MRPRLVLIGGPCDTAKLGLGRGPEMTQDDKTVPEVLSWPAGSFGQVDEVVYRRYRLPAEMPDDEPSVVLYLVEGMSYNDAFIRMLQTYGKYEKLKALIDNLVKNA